MIPVREIEGGTFERLTGNPVLLSLDGKVKAPLRTILAPSWSAEDRARFGVFMVDPATVPEGKLVTARRYERQGAAVVEVLEVEDIPAHEPDRRTPEQKVQALARRFGLTIDELRSVLIQDGKQ